MADKSEKIAIVTGGTQGLGEAISRELIDAKLIGGLVFCGRKQDNGERLAREYHGLGCAAKFVRAELANVEDCREIVATARRVFGRVDFLVNAAALTERGTILDSTPEFFDKMMAVNVRAPFFLMQDSLALMIEREIKGAVVNILSMSAHGGQPFLCPYSMSKGALATLTRNVAHSVRSRQIRVNGLNIGWMDTPGEHTIQKVAHDAPSDWLEKAEKRQPFGRLIKPDEIARLVAYLLSDRSGLITGSIIDFDQNVLGTSS